MLCCAYPWTDSQSSYGDSTVRVSNGASSYPGARRPISTAPLGSPTHGGAGSSQTLISVTVPPGVVGGQTIHVAHPDGSGRLVEAQVPHGMNIGSIFYIQSPPSTDPISPVVPGPFPPSNLEPILIDDMGPPSAYQQDTPFSRALDAPTPVASNSHKPRSFLAPSSPSSAKLLKVTVPPGTAPGSTIYVQIPGETRMVEAHVPPNCSEFHVEYDATPSSKDRSMQQQQQQQQRPYRLPPKPPLAPKLNTSTTSPTRPRQDPPPSQRFVDVAIPPHSTPGSMIHVQVPGEPGRLLQVRIPDAAVTSLRVSYTPQR